MRRDSRRVVALTLGDDDLASSRVRVGAALTSIQKDGQRTTRVSATSRIWPLQILAALLLFRPAVTIVQKVVPPPWFCRLVARLSARLVFECDDAIHLGYGGNSIDVLRISNRLRTLLPLCDCVIVSNALLREDLRKLGANKLVVFPGPAPVISGQDREARHGVLWLGSPSTLENVRSIVYPAFEMLTPAEELTVIGATRNFDGERITERIWSSDLQTAALARARVGVAPQAQDEWSLRKAFYKVLEYLAADVIPVVPAHPAVRTLLGEELQVVAVTVYNDTPAAWATAISFALKIDIDHQWTAARDRIFARWSAARLGQVILGECA